MLTDVEQAVTARETEHAGSIAGLDLNESFQRPFRLDESPRGTAVGLASGIPDQAITVESDGGRNHRSVEWKQSPL